MPSLRLAFRSTGVLAATLGLAGCSNSLRHAGSSAANQTGTAAGGSAAQLSAANPVSAEHLGTVHVIGTSGRFVLVQTPSAQPASVADGQTLVCRAGAVPTATLRVSRERRPPFIAADVTSGEPHVGDEVFVDSAPGHATIPETSHPLPPASSPSSAPTAAPDFRTNAVLPPTR